jgi:hypothetical protein
MNPTVILTYGKKKRKGIKMANKKSLDVELDQLLAGLDLPSDQDIRKETGYVKSSGSKSGQKRSSDQKANMSAWQKGKPKEEDHKEKIGNKMRGKTLEELLGEDRAAAGREARRQANFKQDYTGRGDKIARTRKANGSYESATHGMNGKTHKESTKVIQGQKAKIRQELKRKLGLGKSDSVPKDLLEKAYKKHGLL